MRDYEKIIVVVLLIAILIEFVIPWALLFWVLHKGPIQIQIDPSWKKEEHSLLVIRGMPEFKLQSLSNKTVALSDFRGRVVVTIFWDTQSTDFLEQLKCLKELEDRWSDKVVFLYVNLGEKYSTVLTFAKKHGLDMNRVLLSDAVCPSESLVVRTTSMIIVDEQGKVLKADILIDCEYINDILTEHYNR